MKLERNLRWFIHSKQPHEAACTALRMLRDGKRSPLQRVLAKALLEDKFPEGYRYTKALNQLKKRKRDDEEAFLAVTVALAKCTTSHEALNVAVKALRYPDSLSDDHRQRVLPGVEQTLLRYMKGVDTFTTDQDKPQRIRRIFLEFSSDVVVSTVAYALLGFRSAQQKVPAMVRRSDYAPIADSALRNVDYNIDKVFKLHYATRKIDGVTSVAMHWRLKRRRKMSLPTKLGVHEVQLEETKKNHWLVRLDDRLVRLYFPDYENKQVTVHKTVADKYGVTRKDYQLIEGFLVCPVYEGMGVLTAERLSTHVFDYLKVVVFRHAHYIRTFVDDIMFNTHKQTFFSINEFKKVDKRHPDIWTRLIQPKRTEDVRRQQTIDVCKSWLQTYGNGAFKTYMNAMHQNDLYFRIMESVPSNASARI